MDLLAYLNQHPELAQAPLGLYAVAPAQGEAKAGTLFVLRKTGNSPGQDRSNRLHPFYLVYVGEDGSVLCNHLNPRESLDALRLLCKGQETPFYALCQAFNRETRDGRNMKKQSWLLEKAIASIVEIREESDVQSLFRPGGTNALLGRISGLDDFELICFLVVKATQ